MSRKIYEFTICGNPVPQPRMVKSDKWAKRPCVVRYFDWCNYARTCYTELPSDAVGIHVNVFIQFPEYYSKKKRKSLANSFHRIKPDCDNILKAILDALFKRDQAISTAQINKYWDDGNGARLGIRVW